MCASELQSVAGDITRAVAFMVEKAPELFAKLPDDLVRDIAHYWQQMEEITDPSNLVRSKSEDDLDSSNSSLPHVSECDSSGFRSKDVNAQERAVPNFTRPRPGCVLGVLILPFLLHKMFLLWGVFLQSDGKKPVLVELSLQSPKSSESRPTFQ